MRSEKKTVTAKDLVEEAKKRTLLLLVCVVGLSYLLSLTSSSVLVNLPAAAVLIITIRYFSLDLDMRTKAATYRGKLYTANDAPRRKPLDCPQARNNYWRQKVNSPVVESAMDQFTRHIVSEWVTNLWYSRVTPDKQGPEELVQIINGVLAEISCRMRNINLINLLISDIVGVICVNLVLFRASKTKVTARQSKTLTIEELDIEIKYVLAAENKLHPALFSPETEHKVLQHLMDGLISLTVNPEDLKCSLFRYITRELLACVVMRPILNLASPRFINQKIESLAMSLDKSDKGNMETSTTGNKETSTKSHSEAEGTSDSYSPFPDPSIKGVELLPVKKEKPKPDRHAFDKTYGTLGSKDPLLSIDTKSRSWSASSTKSDKNDGKGLQRHRTVDEWGKILGVLSPRKTKSLAPEHFDDMWSKSVSYNSKEDACRLPDPFPRAQGARMVKSVNDSSTFVEWSRDSLFEKGKSASGLQQSSGRNHTLLQSNPNAKNKPTVFSRQEGDEEAYMNSDDTESKSTSSYTTEDEESDTVTGLDSPSVKVWDRKNRRNVNHIHHPLENFDSRKARKTNKYGSQRLSGSQSKRRKSGLNSHGDVRDVLTTNLGNVKYDDSSDDSETETLNRISSEATASSCVSLAPLAESHMPSSFSNACVTSDSFWKLRCEVLGANIVRSDSRLFAVYSISVTDVNNHIWSIKRRFQHFDVLHQRLKSFPEYNLHLPSKHFLSTGLDVYVIQERSILLDKYLKEILQLPTVSDSIEVWDFLSVDSQTYLFSNPLSIVETLSVDPGHDAHGKIRGHHHNVEPNADPFSPKFRQAKLEKVLAEPRNDDAFREAVDDRLKVLSEPHNDASSDPILPSEWMPPNLSLPILDLVDVIFQLQDGGWIRRKAFWVAKQVLQLGMGDAFDDWLIGKVQMLCRGSLIASGIARLEQILWPDGIFITKHPKRKKPTSTSRPSFGSHHSQPSTPVSTLTVEDIQKEEEQQKEDERQAKFVYDLMLDKAPQAIVGLVGRKEYEQCATDLYSFIQSPVCMRILALDLVELLFSSAFPELDSVFRQVHEEKHRFGVLKRS